MAEFLKSLSKNTLAILLIGGAVIFIVATDPPVTVCSHQIDKFEEAEVGNLLKRDDDKFGAQTRFEKLAGICQQANNLGGCYEFFSSIRSVLGRFRTVSLDCHEDWGSSSVVRDFLDQSLEIMLALPWGPEGPASEAAKMSWYQGPQMELFCRLQDVYALAYGDAAWATRREKLLSGLPGFDQLGREKAWGRSLFSVSCTRYKTGSF